MDGVVWGEGVAGVGTAVVGHQAGGPVHRPQVQPTLQHLSSKPRNTLNKGVGPSTTLAWPGWKHPDQPDIEVEMDTARLETSRLKKQCVNCVLLYYPSTEFKSAFNVY